MTMPASTVVLPPKVFRNISQRYGNPEIITLATYRKLDGDRVFVIRGNEIWALDDKGYFDCVVAIDDADYDPTATNWD